MILATPNTVSNDVEREYSHSTSIEHRKKFAQFFTPYPLADLMAKWLLGNNKLKTVLEQAFGLGVFSRTLLNYKGDISITGFEIDENIFSRARSYFEENENVSLRLEDYMYNDWGNKYDGIICNPPYFKFHDYDNKNVIKEIEERISYKLNGFSNLYTLFLLKSINQLTEKGRAAYIIPSEFLNSDYGKLVKSYLIENGFLRHIIVVNFEENVFDDALTTASVLLFANDNNAEAVQFSNVNNLDDLDEIERLIVGYPENLNPKLSVQLDQLDPLIKWRAYYQEQNSIKFKNLVPFSNYGKVMRGIATGANEYFIFNRSKAIANNIRQENLLPCICKSVDARNSFFTIDDFEALQSSDKHVFLLRVTRPIDVFVQEYLQTGINMEIHKKFLTASRNPWYSLENRPPAPIWVSVFNRTGLRFIRNEAGISNLTTFHCIYLNVFSAPKTDLFFAYLLTDVSKQIFEDNSREYGNGLQKFEPNDINKSQMLDLGQIEPIIENKILEYYYSYRQTVLSKTPNVQYINKINELLLEQFAK